MSRKDPFAMPRRAGSAAGLTLVELMVALAVFSILMLGLGTVYQANKRNGAVQREFAYLQENARFALNLIAQDIRQSGFSGCNPEIKILLDQTDPAYDPNLFDFSATLSGFEFLGTLPGDLYNMPAIATAAPLSWNDAGGNALPAGFTNPVAGSDVLIVKSAQPLAGVTPSAETPQNAASVPLTGPSGVPAGTIVMIADCKNADVFQNTANENAATLTRGVSGNKPGNVVPGGNSFSHTYRQAASLYTASIYGYYVSLGAGGEPGLFRVSFRQGTADTPQELASGIENMQVLYGEDTDATPDFLPNRYVPAHQVTNPKRVVTVKISLLVRSPQEIPRPQAAAAPTLLLAGVNAASGVRITPPNEARLRKVFTTTVFVRNAALCRKLAGDTEC